MEFNPRFLVIRLSSLGDVAMTIPVLRVFVQTYPEVTITVVTRKRFKPLFDEVPNCRVVEADVTGKHKGFFGLAKLAQQADRPKLDFVVDLHGVIRSKIIKGWLFLKGITIASIDKGRKQKKALTRPTNKKLKPLQTTHSRYADVFKKLGYTMDLKTYKPPRRKPLPETFKNLFQDTKKIIGIAPFAAYKSKTYPLELMQEVIKQLEKTKNYHILLFGGGEEELNNLNQLETQFPGVQNASSKLSFKEELALISNLDLMVSMDSGNGHLAAIYGVPVITLWGVTHPFAGFAPFNQPEENQLLSDQKKYPLIPTSVYGNEYPEGYENLMESINPNSVVEKIIEVLE